MVAIYKYTRTTEILWRKRDGMATLYMREGEMPRESPRERADPPPGQAFIAFLGTLHGGWCSFTMHRFTTGDYLLRTTKDRILLIYFKEKDVTAQGGNCSHSIRGWFSTDFRKLKI